MQSCSERISLAMEEVLKSIGAQYGKAFASKQVKVERNRFEPLAEDELPSLILFEGDLQPQNEFSSEDGYLFPFTIQAAIEGRGSDALSRAHALRADLIAAIAADRTLGGLARDVEITSAGDHLGAETPAAETQGFLLGAQVLYATKESNPYAFEHE